MLASRPEGGPAIMAKGKRRGVRPTAAELEVLRVLWRRGPSTVRQVHGEISRRREVAYTTVLRFFQIMTEKGLVTRDDSQRSHIYAAAHSEEDTQGRLLRDLTD